MERRLAAGRRDRAKIESLEQLPTEAVSEERGLHGAIINYCREKWYPWLFIHGRMDKRSTIAAGCQDFTIFADHGRVFLFECKAKSGKPSKDQIDWIHSMELLGHKVHVIRSFSEFLKIVEPTDL